jgi:hypothetical protein
MEKLELEVYSQATNQAIVRIPSRRFPGLVIQGDTLSSLANSAASIYELAKKHADTELMEEACDLKDRFNDYLLHYEHVLGEHNIELPYFRRPLNT